ncbi:MAG: universal stress protein [Breznakibacter sp.]
MKRVLVPIDFSEASMNALEYGLQIANLFEADLRVMHVVTGKHYAPPFEYDQPELFIRGRVDEWMEKVLKDIRPRYKVTGGKVDIKIREGNVTKEISNQAKYDDSSMIVLGSHGISGFEDKWVGSNAYRLVSNTMCPVLLVRKGMPWKPLKKIVLPIDITKESRMKIPVVVGFGKLFNSTIHVVGMKRTSMLFVYNRIKSAIRQVQDFVEKKAGLESEYGIIEGNNLPQKLLEYAENVNADLIAVRIHHDTNPFNDLIRPFVNEVINYSERPVLVVPTHE